MLVKLFDLLTVGLYSHYFIALIVAFIWGVLSVILSPCHISSIPLLVAYIGGQKKLSIKKAFTFSLFFSLGLLLTLGLLGLITALTGRILGDIGVVSNIFLIIVAFIFFTFGLNFLGILPEIELLKNYPIIKKGRIFTVFLMGLIFGIVLGPCTFGFMAPVLAIVFSTATRNLIFSIFIMLLFAIGHCSFLILAGTFTKIVQKYLNWDEKTKISTITKKIFGSIMILISIYLTLSGLKII